MRGETAALPGGRRTDGGRGCLKITPFHYRENTMLKFIGGTAGIIFIIGLIVVIGIFKLIF